MKRARALVPLWAIQGTVGLLLLVVAIALFALVLGAALRGPTAFFDEVGRTVSRVLPQPAADLRSDAELRAVLSAMPNGRLRVATIVEDQDRVVFTVTAERAAVRAAVRPGDELRIGRDGNVEIAPTGIPGTLDQLQRALDDLRRRFFGR